jgi:hypothetical protein
MRTRRPRFACTLVPAVLAAWFSVVATAHADGPDAASIALRLPVAQAQRPITPPSLIFNPALTFDIRHQAVQGSFVDLGIGASLGITDNFSVRALVLPLQLSAPSGSGRSFQYGQTEGYRGPDIGATYRFVHGVVEVGAALDVRVFTIENLSGVAIVPSVPVRIHASDVVAIDFEPSVNITRATATAERRAFTPVSGVSGIAVPTTTTAPASAVRVQLPISVLYNVSEPVHLGVNSGLTIFDVNDAKNSTGIPAGAFLGYAVAGSSGPILDFDPFFEFPYLLLPGRSTVTNAEQYILGLRVTGHLYW